MSLKIKNIPMWSVFLLFLLGNVSCADMKTQKIEGIEVSYEKASKSIDLKKVTKSLYKKPKTPEELIYEIACAQNTLNWTRFVSLTKGFEGHRKKLGVSEQEYKENMLEVWAENDYLANTTFINIYYKGCVVIVSRIEYLENGKKLFEYEVLVTKKYGEVYLKTYGLPSSDKVIRALRRQDVAWLKKINDYGLTH